MSNAPAKVRTRNMRAVMRGERVSTRYTPRKADKILIGLMRGSSLRKICESKDVPSVDKVLKWVMHEDQEKYGNFGAKYYHARRIQAELRVDEIFDIADDTSQDYKIVYDKNGDPKVEANSEHFQRARVRIDARKWFAGSMLPKLYGKQVEVTHDVTNDLKKLLSKASNKSSGLPPPIIDGECEDVTS